MVHNYIWWVLLVCKVGTVLGLIRLCSWKTYKHVLNLKHMVHLSQLILTRLFVGLSAWLDQGLKFKAKECISPACSRKFTLKF